MLLKKMSSQCMFNITYCMIGTRYYDRYMLYENDAGCESLGLLKKNRFCFCRQGCYLSQHAVGIQKHKLACAQNHRGTQTHTLIYRCTPPTVFLSSIVTVCVTDLISPTICWLEAQHRRSYPAWQIQTASVYACFSQGLTQYGRVESPSWPPNLHPHILTSKDLGIVNGTDSFLGLVRAVVPIV